jgi:hypothetical protein
VELIEHVELESAPRVPEGLPKSKPIVLSSTPAGNALRAVSLGVAKATCFERPPAVEHKLCDTRVEQTLVCCNRSRLRASNSSHSRSVLALATAFRSDKITKLYMLRRVMLSALGCVVLTGAQPSSSRRGSESQQGASNANRHPPRAVRARRRAP